MDSMKCLRCQGNTFSRMQRNTELSGDPLIHQLGHLQQKHKKILHPWIVIRKKSAGQVTVECLPTGVALLLLRPREVLVSAVLAHHEGNK